MTATPPRTRLRFDSVGRIDADPRRRVYAEGWKLAATRRFWCGAPALSEERKPGEKTRGRLRGEVDLRFGWQGTRASAEPREDDAFMGFRDGCFVVEVLRRWSLDVGRGWALTLPDGEQASIAEGRVDAAVRAWLDAWADEGGEPHGEERSDALLLRHRGRHGAIEDGPWTSRGMVATRERAAALAHWARLDPATDTEVRTLDEEIRRRRSCGEIWFGVWTATVTGDWDPRSLADRTTSSLGLGMVGARWQALPRPDAVALLALVLREDQAYASPLMSDPEARALAGRFVDLFPGDAQLFTNGVYADGRTTTCHGAVASSTLEGGVVAVSPTRAGILWIGDED